MTRFRLNISMRPPRERCWLIGTTFPHKHVRSVASFLVMSALFTSLMYSQPDFSVVKLFFILLSLVTNPWQDALRLCGYSVLYALHPLHLKHPLMILAWISYYIHGQIILSFQFHFSFPFINWHSSIKKVLFWVSLQIIVFLNSVCHPLRGVRIRTKVSKPLDTQLDHSGHLTSDMYYL